jgi:hypothetical protein
MMVYVYAGMSANTCLDGPMVGEQQKGFEPPDRIFSFHLVMHFVVVVEKGLYQLLQITDSVVGVPSTLDGLIEFHQVPDEWDHDSEVIVHQERNTRDLEKPDSMHPPQHGRVRERREAAAREIGLCPVCMREPGSQGDHLVHRADGLVVRGE